MLTFCLRGIVEDDDDDDRKRKVNGLENYEEGGFFLFSIMMIIFNLHRDTDTDAHFLFWVENK